MRDAISLFVGLRALPCGPDKVGEMSQDRFPMKDGSVVWLRVLETRLASSPPWRSATENFKSFHLYPTSGCSR